MPTSLFLGIALAAPLFATPAAAIEFVGKVVGVTDGDTITVLVERRTIKVRLAEIDAPEKGQPHGSRAKQALSDLVFGKAATVREQTRDRYGRTVGRVYELGMVNQPQRPFAVWPGTVQMTPEGVFETAFGRYLMAVRVRNVWTEPWPAGTRVAITEGCRSWLAAGGVMVVNTWSAADQAAVGQDVVGGRVLVGALDPWESQLVYFKVDVSAARVAKHQVEVAIVAPVAEDLGHLNRRVRGPIFVSRTTFDATRGVFVAECDRGTLTMAVKELVVNYNTLKRAIGRAREVLGEGGPGTGPGGGGRPGRRLHAAGARAAAPPAARVPRGQGRRRLRDVARAAVLLRGRRGQARRRGLDEGPPATGSSSSPGRPCSTIASTTGPSSAASSGRSPTTTRGGRSSC